MTYERRASLGAKSDRFIRAINKVQLINLPFLIFTVEIRRTNLSFWSSEAADVALGLSVS